MITKSKGLPRIHQSQAIESRTGGPASKGSRSKYGKMSSKERTSLAPAKDLLHYIRQSRKYKDEYSQNLDFEDAEMKRLIFCSENQPQRRVRDDKLHKENEDNKHQESEDRKHQERFLPDIVISTRRVSHERVIPNHELYLTNTDDSPRKTRSRKKDIQRPGNHHISPKLSPRQHVRINFPMPTTPRRGRVDHIWPEGHRYHVRLRPSDKQDLGDYNK